MRFLVAAAGAIVAAVAESTIVPYLAIDGAHPHFVIVVGVIWTVAVGLDSGFAWAFAGGIALDVFAQRPLGSTAFVLTLALAGAAVLARPFGRVRRFVPVPLTFILSLASSLLLLVVYGAIRVPIPDADPIRTLLPGVIYDTVLAAAVGPIAVVVVERRRDGERQDW